MTPLWICNKGPDNGKDTSKVKKINCCVFCMYTVYKFKENCERKTELHQEIVCSL